MKYEIQRGKRKGGKGTKMERNIDVKILFPIHVSFSVSYSLLHSPKL